MSLSGATAVCLVFARSSRLLFVADKSMPTALAKETIHRAPWPVHCVTPVERDESVCLPHHVLLCGRCDEIPIACRATSLRDCCWSSPYLTLRTRASALRTWALSFRWVGWMGARLGPYLPEALTDAHSAMPCVLPLDGQVDVAFPAKYPFAPPCIRILTPVLHPGVLPNGKVRVCAQSDRMTSSHSFRCFSGLDLEQRLDSGMNLPSHCFADLYPLYCCTVEHSDARLARQARSLGCQTGIEFGSRACRCADSACVRLPASLCSIAAFSDVPRRGAVSGARRGPASRVSRFDLVCLRVVLV